VGGINDLPPSDASYCTDLLYVIPQIDGNVSIDFSNSNYCHSPTNSSSESGKCVSDLHFKIPTIVGFRPKSSPISRINLLEAR
jgi:hypothetical protein